VSLSRSCGLASRLKFPFALVIAVTRNSEKLKVLQELVEVELEGRVQSLVENYVFGSTWGLATGKNKL
jgi:hypothetical protein